jgi:hypothetical protein
MTKETAMPDNLWIDLLKNTYTDPDAFGQAGRPLHSYTRTDIHTAEITRLNQELDAAYAALEKCRKYQICDEIDKIVLPVIAKSGERK